MMAKAARVALYLRVSTKGQDTSNQRRELEALCEARGWNVAHVYEDHGLSGSKGRDERPQLDLMLKDAVRRRFDHVAVWSIDRLGRSMPDLVASMQTLQAADVGLFIFQQALDMTTPQGKLMFNVIGAFAEFEKSMIQARVHAGLARAKAAGVRLGRPKVKTSVEKAIRARLEAGEAINKVAGALQVGKGTVARVRAAMVQPAL